MDIRLNIEQAPLELRLILSCLRVSAGQDCGPQIRALSERVEDWGKLMRLAERHRVIPFVYKGLKSAKEVKIPKDLLTDLKKGSQLNSQSVLVKSAQLVQIIKHFQAAGVSVLPFKGPTTAMLAYGDVGLRHFSDLDIMVAPNHLWEAERILFDQGFRRTIPHFEMTCKQWPVFFRNTHHLVYVHFASELRVDLHWRFGENRYLFPIGFDDLWRDRQILQLGGVSIPTFGNEHTMLLLCTHGANHTWLALFWLNDVARLAAQKSIIDWPKLMKISKRMGTNRMLAEGLILSCLLLGSPLPEHIKDWAATDKGAVRHMKISFQRMSSFDHCSYKPFTRSYFSNMFHGILLRKDPRYSLVFATRILTAGQEKWERSPLLAAFIPFYTAVRGIRWFLRWYIPGSRTYREGPMGKKQKKC
jgi:hypothetical protein